MDNKTQFFDLIYQKFKKLYYYLPYSKFTSDDYKELCERIENTTSSFVEVLQNEKWHEDYIVLIYEITEKYSLFLINQKDNDEIDEIYLTSIQKTIFKFLILFTMNVNDEICLMLKARILKELFTFLSNKIGNEDVDVLVTLLNQLLTILMEYVGLTIHFFIPIEGCEENYNMMSKYMNNQMAFNLDNCDYLQSDYFCFINKYISTFTGISLFYNRDEIYKNFLIQIFGNKVEIDKTTINIDMQIDSNVHIDFFFFRDLINKLPVLQNPFNLHNELFKNFIKKKKSMT